ncbi:MAG: class I tRNA ligase family protein, partial [Acidobacteriota bacterium]
IPAWYCDACGETIVSRETPANCSRCRGSLRQETDILDTWFSSALWPFSTMGWPEEKPDLKLVYPTDVLITGPDIIFFWVARMIMMGLKFMGDVPFYQVHINGIVRDAGHQKMSKTKGNIVEPLQLVEEYGADAVRFALSSMAVPGTDIPFSTDRMKGYSAFANKVWTAARFVLMNLGDSDPAVSAEEVDRLLEQAGGNLPLEDLWILHRLNRVSREIPESLEKFRFHEASSVIYQFIWHELCDWYLELVKPALVCAADSPDARRRRTLVLVHVMDCSMRLLHPFMPFITEEIWQKLPHSGASVTVREFPAPRPTRDNPEADNGMSDLMDLVGSLRSLRADMNVAPKQELSAVVAAPDEGARILVEGNLEKVKMLARLRELRVVPSPGGAGSAGRTVLKGVWRCGEFALDLEGAVDFQAQRSRIEKELRGLEADVEKIRRKIDNPEFRSRAPQSVIEENRLRHDELLERHKKLERNLRRLPKP